MRLTLSHCGWGAAPRDSSEGCPGGKEFTDNFLAIFPSFLTEMKKAPKKYCLQKIQLGSVCVSWEGGRLSEDGLEGSLISLFGGPDWNVPMVRDWNAELLNQCLVEWSGLCKQYAGKEQFCLMKLQQVQSAPAPPPSWSPFLSRHHSPKCFLAP